MPIGKVWTYRLLFCLFVCLFCVCTVTDFSAEDEASGVKFCTVVHRRPGKIISHFGELCSSISSPEVQNRLRRLRWAAMARATRVRARHMWI